MARFVEAVLWWGALTVVWWATLTVASPAELVTGAVLALPAALAAVAARAALGVRWSPSWRWLRWAARVPGTLVADSARVLTRRAPIEERVVPVAGPDSDRGVAGVLVSATPGTVVVDDGSGGLVVHALGDRPSALERAVGR